jgi:hypothetical protein
MLRTKELMQLLEKFNKGETAGYARVQIVTPEEPNRPRDIQNVTLVENKIIGARESHRLMILVN